MTSLHYPKSTGHARACLPFAVSHHQQIPAGEHSLVHNYYFSDPAAVGVGKGMHHIRLLAEVADHAPALPVVDNKLPMLLIDQQPPYQLHQVR
jgi:hypothetical protein